MAGNAVKDARIYTKAEIVASIPPDKDHEYPTELKYSVPIGPAPNSATNAAFLATVHAAQDGVDRLAVWKKTGDDQYQRLFVQETSSENHFDKPEVFSSKVLVTGQGKDHDETALFLNLPLHRVWGDGEGIDDNVFVLDGDELRPVAIADAEGAQSSCGTARPSGTEEWAMTSRTTTWSSASVYGRMAPPVTPA